MSLSTVLAVLGAQTPKRANDYWESLLLGPRGPTHFIFSEKTAVTERQLVSAQLWEEEQERQSPSTTASALGLMSRRPHSLGPFLLAGCSLWPGGAHPRFSSPAICPSPVWPIPLPLHGTWPQSPRLRLIPCQLLLHPAKPCGLTASSVSRCAHTRQPQCFASSPNFPQIPGFLLHRSFCTRPNCSAWQILFTYEDPTP